MRENRALVTGASSGIGLNVTNYLIEQSWTIIAVYHDTLPKIESKNKSIIWIKADLSCEKGILFLVSELKRLDIFYLTSLINCAGVCIAGPVELTSYKSMEHLLRINLLSTLFLSASLVPILKNGGKIINLGSSSGRQTLPYLGVYSSSKFALRAASQALRFEFSIHGIQVCLIEAGNIATPLWQKTNEGFKKNIEIYISSASPYKNSLKKAKKLTEKAEINAISPKYVSQLVYKLLMKKKLPTSITLGFDALLWKWIDLILPDAIKECLVIKLFNLKFIKSV